jgi:peroxiredoxin
MDKLGTLAPGTGLAVGEHVPDVQALDLDGTLVRLTDLVAKGPLLLVFYRGGWCPYCNYEIHEMTVAFPQYQKRGVLPVAISVDIPEEGAKTNATYTIPFPVLSDSKLAVIDAFHVANHVDDATLAKMKGFGVDLENYSGQAHHTIAIPALFLVDKQGVIRWAHDDPTFTVRPTTAQILGAIDAAHVSQP